MKIIVEQNNVKTIDKQQLGLYARLGQIMLRNLNKYTNKREVRMFFGRFKKEDIQKWIEHPDTYAKELRNASIALYEISPQYKRLINYFAKMMVFAYVITPFKINRNSTIKKESYIKAYNSIVQYIDKINLKHELIKVYTTCFREDVFYGYTYQTADSFYIKKLNPDFCEITMIEDGCFIYSFDFSYFDTYPADLKNYGEEFEERYDMYKHNRTTMRWQVLNTQRQFCIKLNEDLCYPSIPFIGVFEGIFDIQDYKGLKKAKTETDNYKVLSLFVPTDDEGNYKLDYDDIVDYYERLLDVLPENIGAFLTPMQVSDFSFENAGAVDDNNVANATKTFWNDAGVSAVIFGADKVTSATVNLSIQADEEMVFALTRQVERNINRLLKQRSGQYKFKINILDVTIYNQKDMFNLYLKGAQASLPTTTMACATIGLNPADMMNLCELENEILDIPNKFKPLATSYTQSSSGDEGAPTQEDKGEELTEAGELSRDSDVHTEY